MPDLARYFRSAPAAGFKGTVYRICPTRYADHLLSMRGAFLHGARYNIRGYFGALYTSLSQETARQEISRYFTVPPIGGFVLATIGLRLNSVVDLTRPGQLHRIPISREQLTAARFSISREIGLRAWESGLEALLVPSAADPKAPNLALFLDNQHPGWRIELSGVRAL